MENQTNFFLLLPTQVITKITSTLSLKEIFNCMLVCKLWHSHIPNPLLAKTDVQFLFFDHKPPKFAILDDNAPGEPEDQTTTIKPISFPSTFTSAELYRIRISACNGLVCFFYLHNDDIADVYVCNPTVGECVSVPKPSHDATFLFEIYDLGFSPCSNQYKLARFVRNDDATELDIYTFGSPDGWRRHAGDVPSRIWNKAEGAICAKGVLHWLLSPNHNNKRSILTLDLAEERFGSVVLPRVGDDMRIYSMGYMDECLVVTAGHNPPLGLEIWARRECRGEGPVWTRDWVIDATQSFELGPNPNNKDLYPINLSFLIPRKLSSDGRIFMTYQDSRLFCYGQKDRLVTLTSKNKEPYPSWPWPSVTAYTTNGVSPNQLIEDNDKGKDGKIELKEAAEPCMMV